MGTLLVAEEIGAPPGRWLAVGETVALPVGLLGHAAPDELLLSDPMARLIEGMEVTSIARISGKHNAAQCSGSVAGRA